MLRALLFAALALAMASCAPASAPPAAAPAATTAPAKAEPAKPQAKAEPAKPAAPAAAAPTSPPAAAAAKPAAKSAEFQKILDGAKAEGAITVWLSVPKLDDTKKALFEAFEKRFDVKVAWEWLNLHETDSLDKLLVESKAGRKPADLISTSGIRPYRMEAEGLLKPYDWESVFGSELQGIGKWTRPMEGLEGRALRFWDVAYQMMFNTDLVKASEVPSKIEALVEPQWKGRMGLTSTGGAPFDRLSLVIGDEQALALARDILKNQPLRKQGSPALGEAVIAGETGLAVVSPAYAMEGKAKRNAPVDWKPMEYIPLIPLLTVVPESAPHPNMARLFAAWLATEGMAIMDQYEYLGRVDDPTTTLGKIITQQMPNAPIYTERSRADFEKTDAFSKKLAEVFQQQQ
jgi:spermidine/putrescine-binding protein